MVAAHPQSAAPESIKHVHGRRRRLRAVRAVVSFPFAVVEAFRLRRP